MSEPQADLSFVIPAYNEAGAVGPTVERLFAAFAAAGYRLEIVAVDNGSTDGTGEVLRQLQQRHPALRVHRVELNEGYG
ncbi:MAG TPA: glycosyltransferase, partial [Gemmatimonadales bacterium]|nr:glycosyltransferase [Gemmatimonadales bacterium]